MNLYESLPLMIVRYHRRSKHITLTDENTLLIDEKTINPL